MQEESNEFTPKAPNSREGAPKYLGVGWYARTKKWTVFLIASFKFLYKVFLLLFVAIVYKASITVSKKNQHLGYFHTPEEAARKYDEKAGPLKRPVNFPETAPKDAPNASEEEPSRKIPNSTSKYLGVCFYARTKKWTASIHVAKKNIHIGYYVTEEEVCLTCFHTLEPKTKLCVL